jgi:intracellular sulfur oxidation DsrE/DsrF family protein
MVRARVYLLVLLAMLPPGMATAADAAGSRAVQTPYTPQKVVFDFYLDEPDKINGALYWLRALVNPLLDEPYGYAPEMLDIKVVVHGTEIVTLARKNEARYRDAVARMRYYASLGVQFKVCGLAARDYGYRDTDFQDFVEVVPSAIAELAHWQLQGHALITPVVPERKFSLEEIR